MKVLRVRTGLVALICLAASAAWALADNPVVWSEPVPIGAGNARDAVKVASPETDVAYVVFRRSAPVSLRAHVYFTRTLDGGRSWSEPRGLDEPTFDVSRAFLCATASGRVYVLMVASNPGSTSDLLFIKSDDRGETWTPSLVPVARARPIAFSYPVLFRCDEAGNVYVLFGELEHTWFTVSHDFGETWRGAPVRIEALAHRQTPVRFAAPREDLAYALLWTHGPLSSVYAGWVVVTFDGGESWSPPSLVVEGDNRLEIVDLAADAVGHANVIWWHSLQKLVARRSPDFGRSFEAPVVVDESDGFGSTAAATDCLGGVFVLHSPHYSTGRAGVFLSRSLDFGATFGSSTLVSEDLGQGFSQVHFVHATDDGQVVAIWLDDRGEPLRNADVLINHSSDRGRQWQPSDLALNGDVEGVSGGWPVSSALNSSGQAFVVWGQPEPAGGQIVKSAAGAPPIAIVAGDGIAILPPEGGFARIRFFLGNRGSESLFDLPVWLDMTGPGGGVTPPIVVPRVLSRLTPGDSVERTRRIGIPSRLSPGPWLVNLRVGPPVADVGSFCVYKLP